PCVGGATMTQAAAAPRARFAGGSGSSLQGFFGPFFPGIEACFRLAIGGACAALWLGAIILLIGADDLLHQVVTHHVFFTELRYADSFNFFAYFQSFHQAG